MKQFSILGYSAQRFAATLLPAAPENLRCPGRPGPQAGFHFEAQWQNVATYAGRVQEVALDHSCNLFVVDMAGNQVVKYNADGQQVATLKMLAREPFTDDVAGIAVAPD